MTAPEPVLADVELRTGSVSRGAARASVVAPLRSREPAEPLFSLLQGEEWMADARCRTLPPAVFFPVDLTGVVQAKRICAVCTVTTSCLEYALEHNLEHGVWGGTSERARRKLRRLRRAPAA